MNPNASRFESISTGVALSIAFAVPTFLTIVGFVTVANWLFGG